MKKFAFASIWFFLVKNCLTISSHLGLIENVSLIIFNSSSTFLTGSLSQCLCQLSNQSQYFSMNYYPINQTCQFFQQSDRNKFFILIDDLIGSFYFLSLPIETVDDWTEIVWTFDSNLSDQSNRFIGIGVNNPLFSSSTIAGYGSSLSLSSSSQQGVLITDPFLKLCYRSWTFEAWIYLSEINNTIDYAIIGQCERALDRICLHLIIRRSRLYFGFYGDDLRGTQNLFSNTWYHVAFVFDRVTRNQSIYLDGFLQISNQTTDVYQGLKGFLTFGYESRSSYISYFNGSIDQINFVGRAKTSDEILRDASLTVYCSFDNGSIDDQGPLKINITQSGTINFTHGLVDQSLSIKKVNFSYVLLSRLVLLGTSNRSYSIALWIRPSRIESQPILYLSQSSDGIVGWCLSILGLTSTGTLLINSYSQPNVMISVTGPVLQANRWIHVVMTYSQSNGLCLFINGTRISSSLPFDYLASGVPNYLFIGSSLTSSCATSHIMAGQYEGEVDEFYLFSRELASDEILRLANP